VIVTFLTNVTGDCPANFSSGIEHAWGRIGCDGISGIDIGDGDDSPPADGRGLTRKGRRGAVGVVGDEEGILPGITVGITEDVASESPHVVFL